RGGAFAACVGRAVPAGGGDLRRAHCDAYRPGVYGDGSVRGGGESGDLPFGSGGVAGAGGGTGARAGGWGDGVAVSRAEYHAGLLAPAGAYRKSLRRRRLLSHGRCFEMGGCPRSEEGVVL